MNKKTIKKLARIIRALDLLLDELRGEYEKETNNYCPDDHIDDYDGDDME